MTALDHNEKTFRSLDLSTLCPRIKNGNPCEYCYVNNARKLNSIRAKKVEEHREYNNEILRMHPSTINKLNKCGGLRLFSFGDYEPWMKPQINQIIKDAEVRKLKLKAITKQRIFVKDFGDKVFINISIDCLKPIPEWVWKARNKNIRIRMMIRNKEEAKQWHKKVDILTPYHGKRINDQYKPKEAMEACKYLAPKKTCCITGSCSTCRIMCGRAKIS